MPRISRRLDSGVGLCATASIAEGPEHTSALVQSIKGPLGSSHAANLLAPYRSRPGPAASRTRASKNKHLDQPPKGRPPRLRCTSTQPPWGGRMTPWDDCTVTGFHAPSCVPMRVYCRLFRQRRPVIWRIEAGAPWHLRGRPVIRKRNSRSEAVGAREPNTKQNHRTNTALARAQLGLSAISK